MMTKVAFLVFVVVIILTAVTHQSVIVRSKDRRVDQNHDWSIDRQLFRKERIPSQKQGAKDFDTNSPECKVTEFQCKNESTCLPNVWLCDGDIDCKDASDENNCNSIQSHGCPVGFVYVGAMNQCYAFIPDVHMTQQLANTECSRRHRTAHLPVIENKNQEDVIIRLLTVTSHSDKCPVGLWTSGRRSHPFRSFDWERHTTETDGRRWRRGGTGATDRLTYTNWAPNRPWYAFGLKENCVYMDKLNAWKWNQGECDAELCVMCQVDLF